MKIILLLCIFLFGCVDSTFDMFKDMGFVEVAGGFNYICQQYIATDTDGDEWIYVRCGDEFYKKVHLLVLN